MEVVLQDVKLLLGISSRVFQQSKEIMHIPKLLTAVVNHNTAVGQDCKGTRSSSEGGNLKSLHKVRIVIGYGYSLVFKATEAAWCGRGCKHHYLRLIGNNRVYDYGLLIQNQILKLAA